MPKLLIRHPDEGESSFTLSGERITLGRGVDNSIQVNHSTISGHHAEFIAVNGRYKVRDLDSTNHSFVDGAAIREADLDRQCRMTFGTVECDYLPDEAETAPDETDVLRKTVGLLRRQNDELIAKISEQQSQINILGNARFLTPAAGADLASLREQIKFLTNEGNQLAQENEILFEEVVRLRGIISHGGDPQTVKEALSVSIPKRSGGEPRPAPDFSEREAPPAVPVVKLPAKPLRPGFQDILDLNKKLRLQIALLARHPEDRDATGEMLRIADAMTKAIPGYESHPVARLAGSLLAFLQDAFHRTATVDQRTLHTITETAEFFERLLTHEMIFLAESLPSPQIVAVDDDAELLPLIVTSLESAMLPTIGCVDARSALDTLQEKRCDLILLDVALPDLSGIDLYSCIRVLPKHHRTPIVFLSGQDVAENRIIGSLKGAADFIAKPYNAHEITLKAHTWALKNQLGMA